MRRHSGLLHREHSVDGKIFQYLCLPAGPEDREFVRLGGVAQAEVDAPVVLREVAGTGNALSDQSSTGSQQFQMCSNAIAIASLPFQLHRQPVIAVSTHVVEKG